MTRQEYAEKLAELKETLSEMEAEQEEVESAVTDAEDAIEEFIYENCTHENEDGSSAFKEDTGYSGPVCTLCEFWHPPQDTADWTNKEFLAQKLEEKVRDQTRVAALKAERMAAEGK